jgi:signal transduction histidine kinase
MTRAVIILLFFACATLRAQDGSSSLIDSLSNVLDVEKDKFKKIDLLNRIAVEYYNIDLKKSLQIGQEALAASQREKYDRGIQQASNVLMRVHRRMGNFSVAIEYSLSKIPIAERLRDTLDLIDSYSSLGNIYSSLERYRESRFYLQKAYRLGKEIHAPNLATIMNYIGRGYGKAGIYDSAEYWIKEALLQEEKFPQADYTLSYIYNNLAEIYYYQNRNNETEYFYSLALKLPAAKTSPFGQTFTLNGLARMHLRKNDFPKAIDAVLKSIEVSKKNSYRDKTKESYGILHEIYEAQHDYKNALYFYKLFNLYQDSIFSEDKLQYIENLKVNYETERVARENEILKKDTELKDARLSEQRSFTIGLSLAIVSLLALLTVFYFNNRQRKRTNLILSVYNQSLEKQVETRTQELVNTNLELIRQNSQLEQFGYIIAHNLRAPVARMLGLANLVKSSHFKLPDDQIILDKIQYSAHDLDTIIHDLNSILEVKKGVHHAFEDVSLPEKLTKVRNMLREKIAESRAVIIENVDPLATWYGIPAYVESILYNLISNAIKYRAPERLAEIKISCHKVDEHLVLQVEDNGIGINLEKQRDKIFSLYQRFHDHVEGKGIGLYLVKTQVEALNGKIEITSRVNEGSLFTVHIPSQRKATVIMVS